MNGANTTLPIAVATIIGCPEELKGADGLVATPLVMEEASNLSSQTAVNQLLPEDTSHIKDPVQRAVIDNILGKTPTKVPQEKLKCEVCNVEVTAKSTLLTHLNGARHAKRMKEESLDAQSLSPFIQYKDEKKIYFCTLCNATLNAKVQIKAHLAGSKHRNRLGAEGKMDDSNTANTSSSKSGDLQSLLHCHTCNIFVNSETQLSQHTSSKKHLNKLNSAGRKSRPTGGGKVEGGGREGVRWSAARPARADMFERRGATRPLRPCPYDRPYEQRPYQASHQQSLYQQTPYQPSHQPAPFQTSYPTALRETRYVRPSHSRLSPLYLPAR